MKTEGVRIDGHCEIGCYSTAIDLGMCNEDNDFLEIWKINLQLSQDYLWLDFRLNYRSVAILLPCAVVANARKIRTRKQIATRP